MKKLITILFLFLSSFAYSQDVTVVHFNYKWTQKNDYSKLKSIKSVPTIIIYKGDKPVARFEAGLSMKIEIPLDKLQEIVNRYKN